MSFAYILARALARILGRHAERVLAVVRPEQGRAIAAEIEHIASPWAALRFAGGGVVAAWRRRFSGVAAGIVGARLMIALAAGMLGYIHLQIPGRNLVFKIAQMRGEDAWLAATVPHLSGHVADIIASYGLAHWAWKFTVLGGMGALHLVAATAMAFGATRMVFRGALAIAALAIAMPMLGAGGLTLPVIYLIQIGVMAFAAWNLARLWRRDEQRMAAR